MRGGVSPAEKHYWATVCVPAVALGAHSAIDFNLSLGAVSIFLFALLGAGRSRKEDSIDHRAGILLRKKPGDPVQKGETLAELHTAREQRELRAPDGSVLALVFTDRVKATVSGRLQEWSEAEVELVAGPRQFLDRVEEALGHAGVPRSPISSKFAQAVAEQAARLEQPAATPQAGAVLMTLLFALMPINLAPRIGLGIGAVLALAGGLVSLWRARPS